MCGVDSSPDMLAKAREVAPALKFSQANAGDWTPEQPLDVIFCNAVLHWLPDHGKLFPRLMSLLTKDGVLAVQMPRNHESPSHKLMLEAAAGERWKSRLAAVQGINPVHDPAYYHRALAAQARDIDIWESEYLHVLTGPDPPWSGPKARHCGLISRAGRRCRRFTADYRRLVAKAFRLSRTGGAILFRRIFILSRGETSSISTQSISPSRFLPAKAGSRRRRA
jgi:trans-aconitate 2-methyltransferase